MRNQRQSLSFEPFGRVGRAIGNPTEDLRLYARALWVAVVVLRMETGPIGPRPIGEEISLVRTHNSLGFSPGN